MASGFFIVYLLLSTRRHAVNLTTGYDLGIFTQIVQSYSELTAPYSSLKGPLYNTLGDHFHPILALLAPAFRIFPSSYTLLVCQAALAAVSVIPLMSWAAEIRGRNFALWAGVSYGASWGIAELIFFDFHEVAFAVPLTMMSVCMAGRGKWSGAVLWAAPLTLVKEDLGLTVAAIGVYVAWKGPRTTGILLAVFGVTATAVEMLVVLPHFNPVGQFAYWPPHTGEEVGLLAQAAGTFWPPVKWLTALLVVAPTGFMAMRSPLVIIALPTLAWRFASANPYYWGTEFHYSAVLMPIVFASAVHAVATGRIPSRKLLPACAVGAAVTAVTFFTHPLHELAMPRTWSESSHVRAADELLSKIPDGATVASSNRLAAQLASRTTVTEVCLFPRAFPPKEAPEWVIYDATDVSDPECATGKALESSPPGLPGYHLVEVREGIALLRRSTEAPAPSLW
ncbi:DUF2079 domain-containing protein [Streptomyces griseus]|uniref:DUF2079 domain-containing protein n=1 Tax=Streptomyces griseus TaxID=1911 RepID=UPI00131D8332|nr:DUF2079 domain-containing protein [Streptomyces griseus]